MEMRTCYAAGGARFPDQIPGFYLLAHLDIEFRLMTVHAVYTPAMINDSRISMHSQHSRENDNSVSGSKDRVANLFAEIQSGME